MIAARFETKRFGAALEQVTLATLPIAEVSNGHTFFVQKLHDIVGVPPVCVHTTYQYGDATAYAYGKRERLRDAHLWLLDTPQSHWSGRFLQLSTAPARLLGPRSSELLLPSVIDPDHCVRSHLKLIMLQRQWLMDGFLLAKALRRTLVLPPVWCMLDKFWTILDHCLIGSKVEMPQPFVCPLDHSFSLGRMVAAGLEWREHSFLTNPLAPPDLLASRARLHVGDAAAGGASTGSELRVDGGTAGSGAGAGVRVRSGTTFAELVADVEASPTATSARVLEIDAEALGTLCRCTRGMSPELVSMSRRLPSLLESDFHYCDTTDNPYFVECKKHGRQGCRKHRTYLMNVSKGMSTPPVVPSEGCGAGKGCAPYWLPTSHITEGVIGATSK